MRVDPAGGIAAANLLREELCAKLTCSNVCHDGCKLPRTIEKFAKDKAAKSECRVAGYCMRNLRDVRAGKPRFYPDQSVYAEYACAEFGLAFEDIDGGTGLLFNVASKNRCVHFGAGRCSWYPQNSATASTLASDKFFTNRILERAGVPTLGGEYFFLHQRHRAHRPEGHEREDALACLQRLGGAAFVKPLTGRAAISRNVFTTRPRWSAISMMCRNITMRS